MPHERVRFPLSFTAMIVLAVSAGQKRTSADELLVLLDKSGARRSWGRAVLVGLDAVACACLARASVCGCVCARSCGSASASGCGCGFVCCVHACAEVDAVAFGLPWLDQPCKFAVRQVREPGCAAQDIWPDLLKSSVYIGIGTCALAWRTSTCARTCTC